MGLFITVFIVIQFIPTKQTVNISETTEKKIVITTTIFPVYDIARHIAGDKAVVKMLIPPGLEVHSYDPSPNEIIGLKKSKIFFYTSNYMETWVSKIIPELSNSTVVIKGSDGIKLINSDTHGHEGAGHVGVDPHIWLDPVNMKIMADNFAEELMKIDQTNSDYYSIRLEEYKRALDELDREIEFSATKFKIKTIIYGGHYAFGYFSKKYGLNHISPYKNFSPNSEPTPNDIKEMIEITKSIKANYIFYEEMLSPKTAETIANECNVSLLMLNGAHNVSKDELKAGITYIDIMKKNLENLRKGLDSVE